MESIINYGGVIRSSALEDHIEHHLKRLQSKTNLDRSSVRVWINREAPFVNRGLPLFLTRIEVKKPGLKALVVEAKSNYLAQSINRAAVRIIKRIRKNKKGGAYEQKLQHRG